MVVAVKVKAHGLYNTVPDYSISKYDLCRLFNHYLCNLNIKVCIPIIICKSLWII